MRLIYYTPPGTFLIVATFEDLLRLVTDHGFYCCRNVQPYTPSEQYVSVEVPELRQMWASIHAMDQIGKWNYEKERHAWDAHYLTTETGLYQDIKSQGLAGVVEPVWHFTGPGPQIRWDLQIGLHWDRLPLTSGALRLIEMAN